MIKSRAAVDIAVVLGATIFAFGAVGCGSHSSDHARATTHSTDVPPRPVSPLPPEINEAVVVPGPVSRLSPGVRVMVDQGPVTTICTAGFYVKFPDGNDPQRRSYGFVTAAQCAGGDSHAPVSVMKSQDDGMAPVRTAIGEFTYLTSGVTSPAVAGEPWTIPEPALAVFGPGRGGWVLPVDGAVNGQPPADGVVSAVDAAQHGRSAVSWTGSDGGVVTGRVLEPAEFPELRDIPTGVDRVVVAADESIASMDAGVLGASVTAQADGSRRNLGIVTGIDRFRNWVVVDLIGPFLTQQNAELVVHQ